MISAIASSFASAPDTIWTRVWDSGTDEQCRYIQELTDGSIIMAGPAGVYATLNRDLLVVKFNSSGTQLWAETFGTPNAEGFSEGTPTSDDAFVMVGYTGVHPDYDPQAIKITNDGDSVWATTYLIDYGEGAIYGVCEMPGGDLLMAGSVTLTGGNRQGWLIRTDSDGDTVWTRHYGTTSMDFFRGQVEATHDGYYLLVGEAVVAPDNRYNYWLVKVDALGREIFSRTYGGEDIDRGDEVVETNPGTYIVGGSSYSYGNFSGDSNPWLLVTNSSGDSVDSYIMESPRPGGCIELLATPDGGVVSSNTDWDGGATLHDVWLTRLDANGNLLWESWIIEDSLDQITEMEQTADGGFLMGGITCSFGPGDQDAWILRYGEENLFELSIRPHYGTPHMKLFWYAPYPGDYLLYSTLDPNLMTAPPGPGWDLEITLHGSAPGMASWDHDNAIGPGQEQRQYRVLWEP